MDVNEYRRKDARMLVFPPMGAKKGKEKDEEVTALYLRGIPMKTYYRFKMAAAAQHMSIKDLLLNMIEGKIQELEKKGLLPKGKG